MIFRLFACALCFLSLVVDLDLLLEAEDTWRVDGALQVLSDNKGKRKNISVVVDEVVAATVKVAVISSNWIVVISRN